MSKMRRVTFVITSETFSLYKHIYDNVWFCKQMKLVGHDVGRSLRCDNRSIIRMTSTDVHIKRSCANFQRHRSAESAINGGLASRNWLFRKRGELGYLLNDGLAQCGLIAFSFCYGLHYGGTWKRLK